MMAERKKWYRVLAVLLVLSCILSLWSVRARAADEDELGYTREYYNSLKEQAKALDDEIKQLNSSIDSGRATTQQRQRQQAANREKAALLEEQIDLKLREIELGEAAIAEKQESIQQRQQEYNDNYELFTQRLVAIYKMNTAGVASTILSVNSFSELLTVNNTLQRISQHDTDMLDNIERIRKELEAEKAELETLLQEMQDARDALNADLKELEEANAALGRQIENDMAQLALQEEELAALKQEREDMQAAMDHVFANLPASEGAFVGGDVAWPVPGHEGDRYISSYFGPRTLYGVYDYHTGIDISKGDQAYIDGKTIVAAMEGTVVFVQANSNAGYGNYLILDHGDGVRTLYAHCKSISVSVGTVVQQNDPIATVGNTGNSTGPHLHFEIRINNTTKVDPYPYLMGQKSL